MAIFCPGCGLYIKKRLSKKKHLRTHVTRKFPVEVREKGKTIKTIRRSITVQQHPAPWFKETRMPTGMPLLIFFGGKYHILQSDAGNINNPDERKDSFLESLYIEIGR
jgi:hypothetical protein